ncbi:MAG: hypothetical protein MK369_01400 [SAR202 cluster bacterium]|nr:hypothetical protein [SAR202 cluster bacterium]
MTNNIVGSCDLFVALIWNVMAGRKSKEIHESEKVRVLFSDLESDPD